MTDSTAPDPLDADLVDELLSAQLDGAFDDAARDHGLTPEDARARLDATPGVDARRRDLELARGALRAPVALDDLTRRRLLDGAAAPRRRASVTRWLARSAGVAAAIAVVVGVVAVARRDTNDDNASTGGRSVARTTASAAEGASAPPSTIDDEEQLRAFLRSQATAKTEGRAATTAPASGQPLSSEQQGQSYASAGTNCPTQLARDLHLQSPISATARVTHDDKPAIVIVFSERSGDFGVLYRPTDCHIYISAFSKR